MTNTSMYSEFIKFNTNYEGIPMNYDIKIGDKFINIKNGSIYTINNTNIINTTNDVDGQIMIEYYKDNMYFVREISEFLEKFTKVEDNDIPIYDRFNANGKLSSGTLVKHNHLDAGQDVVSNMNCVISPHSSAIIDTNLHIAVPEGCVGLLWSRSGLSVKHNIEVGAGCIDAGYTGEVKVHLYNHGTEEFNVSIGDRIAQLITIPINLNSYIKVDELSDSDRGDNGFGSTGR